MDVAAEIRRLGGAAKALELRAAGATPGLIRAWRRAGLVRRPRKGWYVEPSIPQVLFASVRVGGRATCVTALVTHGIWVTEPDVLVHVAVHRAACELRAVTNRHERQSEVSDAVVHWRDTPKPRNPPGSRLVEPVAIALRDALACLSIEDVYASAESALHQRKISEPEWGAILRDATRRQRGELRHASRLSDSGLESRFVFRMRRIGIAVRQQVRIGPDRVDALLGDRLVVELDGAGYHDTHADHVRDARLVAAGYLVLHFDYLQVMHDWDSVSRAILAVVGEGLHLS